VPLLTELRVLRYRIKNNIQKIKNKLNKLENNILFEKEVKQLSFFLNKLNVMEILLEIIEFRLEIYIELRIALPYLYSIVRIAKEIIKDFQLPEIMIFLEKLERNLPEYGAVDNKYLEESKISLEKIIRSNEEAIKI